MDDKCFDDAFFSILQDCKSLPNFFDAIFGFLKRRTDFYCVAPDKHSPVGLPEGLAEHFVKSAFFKWNSSPANNASTVEKCSSDVSADVKEINTKQSTVENKTLQQNFNKSESYNGSVFENYTWSQTITDVDIIVKVPDGITTKNLLVSILPQSITVKVKDSGALLLTGDLCQKIKHNDAIWSLDKHKLEIHLDKAAEMWWNCLVQTEPKIDVTKIDCSRPFEDLSEEAQAKIAELTWNQDRKMMGLPTSEEIALQKTFQKACNADGSPFKSSLDPNTVTFIN